MTTWQTWIIEAYRGLIVTALPVAFFIAACNIAINILFNAFSGGRLRIGGGGRD